MIADTFNRDTLAAAAKEMNAASPDTRLQAGPIVLPPGGKIAAFYLVNETNPHAMSAVLKICTAATKSHGNDGVIVRLTAEEMDALKDPDEFRAFPPPAI